MTNPIFPLFDSLFGSYLLCPIMLQNVTGVNFHHIGVACDAIEDDEIAFSRLGYSRESEPFCDVEQGIRGLFMVGGGPRIELLCDLSGSNTIRPWLNRRVKFYHVAYETSRFDEELAEVISKGSVMVREPVLSTFFGQRIAFTMSPTRMLVEFVEKRHD